MQLWQRVTNAFKTKNKGKAEWQGVVAQVAMNDALAVSVGGWDEITSVRVVGKNYEPSSDDEMEEGGDEDYDFDMDD